MRTDQFRFGTPTKGSNLRAMLKYALRNKMGDEAITACLHGTMTKARLYGRHPTKRR